MSTQRPEDVSEAVVAPVAAAGEPATNADALSPDDTNSADGSTTDAKETSSEELEQAVGSSEREITEKVRRDPANAPSTDFSQNLSKNADR